MNEATCEELIQLFIYFPCCFFSLAPDDENVIETPDYVIIAAVIYLALCTQFRDLFRRAEETSLVNLRFSNT